MRKPIEQSLAEFVESKGIQEEVWLQYERPNGKSYFWRLYVGSIPEKTTRTLHEMQAWLNKNK